MQTFEQVKRLWESFVLKFLRVLTKEEIDKGFSFLTQILNRCEPKKTGENETPLTGQAEAVLVQLDLYLVGENEFFEGYLVA